VLQSRRSFQILSITAVGGVVLLSACGGGGGTSGGGGAPTVEASGSGGSASGSTPSVSKDDALAAMVPQAIASDGKISVGTDATYAPSEFLAADGKTVEGFDVDLFRAVAQKLGLQAEFTSAPFGNIIPSVESGKYEIGVSSFSVTPERIKTVDMVSYYLAGTAWATKKGNPTGVAIDNACGKRIAVQKATTQLDDITKRDQECKSAGKPAITIDQYQGQDQATAAVVSGKDEAMLADSPVIAYAVKQTNGQLEQLGNIYEAAPYGYVTKKGEMPFDQALVGAVTALIKDGTYKKILDNWGVGAGAVTVANINQP
jgi:polar amino acid transport system substrate-binding protein